MSAYEALSTTTNERLEFRSERDGDDLGHWVTATRGTGRGLAPLSMIIRMGTDELTDWCKEVIMRIEGGSFCMSPYRTEAPEASSGISLGTTTREKAYEASLKALLGLLDNEHVENYAAEITALAKAVEVTR